jgi:hypothetical protein
MLGVYVQQVAGGDNLAGRDDLSDDTIRQYLQAANVALRFHFNLLVPVFTQGNGSMQSDRLDPYLSEILASRRNWKRPIPKKEAFSAPMLTAMRDLARQAIKSSAHGWLLRDAVLYDFVILGIFTGSRLAEFGQSNVPPGSKADGWNVIPDNSDVPREWRGLPIAFMVSDFQFFSEDRILLAHEDVCEKPLRAVYVSVRFRYDKSKFNFIYRQFKRVHGIHLCAVAAAIRIIRRAYLGRLLNPLTDPVGLF